MKTTLTTLFFASLMSAGSMIASTTPAADSAAADVKRGAEVVSVVRAIEVEPFVSSADCLDCLATMTLPRELINLIKQYLKGHLRIQNNLPADNGLVVVGFQDKKIQIIPGQTVDLFAGIDLTDLFNSLSDGKDGQNNKPKSIDFKISFYAPKKGKVDSETHAVDQKMMLKTNTLVVGRDKLSIQIVWQ